MEQNAKVLPLAVGGLGERVGFVFFLLHRSGARSVYLRRCETAAFSQRAAIPVVLSLDRAPAPSIPRANPHQSASRRKGNAQKVYFKTQCDFTVPPSGGKGEGQRLGQLSLKLAIDVWRRPLREISQEAPLVTDTRRVTLSDCPIRRGRSDNPRPALLAKVVVRKGAGGVASGPERQRWEKFALTFSTQPCFKRRLIDSPARDPTRHAHVFWPSD